MRLIRHLPLPFLCFAIACGGSTQTPDTEVPDSTPAPSVVDHAAATPEPGPTPAAARTSIYPESQRQDVVDVLHGVKVADPYRWLENASDARVQAWLDAQDKLAHAKMDALPRRPELVERFKELYYLDFVSPPYHRAGRYFFTKRHKDKEKSVVYWKQGEKGEEKVLFDPNTWSEDGSVSLRGYSLSWNGRKVAYKKSQNNADESTLYIRDLVSGKDSEIDVIPGAKYAGPSWTPDNKGFYYEYLPTDDSIPVQQRPGYTELRYHRLGSDPAKDPVIFPATGDPRTFLGGSVSRDGRWLILKVQRGWNQTDVYVKDLRKKQRRGKGAAKAAKSREELAKMTTQERVAHHAAERGFVPMTVGNKAIFRSTWWRGSFYVYTNHQAPNYRIFKVSAKNIGDMSRWKELVAESEAKMDGMQIIGNHLVIPYLRNAASEIEIRNLSGKLVRKVDLPEIGSSRSMLGNPDEDKAYFAFSSFTTPTQIYSTSIKTGKTKLWYELELPIDTSKIESRQVWYTSKDGTKVSMFLVHRKGMDKTGQTPVLLTGYGGFNVSRTPYFSSTAALWLEHGGMYAIPNLRGGGEYGEKWHKGGMLDKKQNVFDDFISAAEYLIQEGFTNPDKLAIAGGSNGGLLVGAAMIQRPDLFRAVVCSVPLLDMVRYHKFGSGETWVPEYGSADDPEQFKYLHAYSPYHHVKKGTSYPSMLMMTADSDDRVDPMHARKFAAAIQWATTSDDRPILVRVERNAGHSGGDMVKKSVQRSADTTSYLMWQLGM